jgi:hypothetical protein
MKIILNENKENQKNINILKKELLLNTGKSLKNVVDEK